MNYYKKPFAATLPLARGLVAWKVTVVPRLQAKKQPYWTSYTQHYGPIWHRQAWLYWTSTVAFVATTAVGKPLW
jgi:hypothetical protein